MTDMLMELTGVNDNLEVYNDKIIIRRIRARHRGDKTIFLNQITGIELKEGGRILSGYIQFTIPGSTSNSTTVFEAAKNENTVVFVKKYNDLAKEAKLKIEALIESQPALNQSISNPDVLRKYKQLFDDGIITKEEFEFKKKEILGI